MRKWRGGVVVLSQLSSFSIFLTMKIGVYTYDAPSALSTFQEEKLDLSVHAIDKLCKLVDCFQLGKLVKYLLQKIKIQGQNLRYLLKDAIK